MSEQRLEAYCIGLKALGPGGARIQNTLQRSDLERIAHGPDEAAL